MNKNNYYVINTESEDLSVSIVAGPLSQPAAQEKMFEETVKWLQYWGIACTENEAIDMYRKAVMDGSEDDENPMLHVSERCASIIHGGGYEDRYQIVQYNAVSN